MCGRGCEIEKNAARCKDQIPVNWDKIRGYFLPRLVSTTLHPRGSNLSRSPPVLFVLRRTPEKQT